MNPSQIRIGEKLHEINIHGADKLSALPSDLDSSVWIDCDFEDCELSGADISDGIFVNCCFTDTCLYWCMAFRATFIDCEIIKCDLRGSFDEAKFLRCEIMNCEVGDNNLGGTIEWENAVAVDCVVKGTSLPIVVTAGHTQPNKTSHSRPDRPESK